MSLGWRKSNPSGSQFSGDPLTGKPLPSEPEADQHDPGESLPEVAGGNHPGSGGGIPNFFRSFDVVLSS